MRKILNKEHFINNKYLYLILVVGLLLRIIGADYGYPYVYNIDEPTIIRSTLGLRYSSEIGHFDWPHFNFYFHFIFYFIFIKLRGLVQIVELRDSIEGLFPILWSDPFVFYFISRIVHGILGALTIIPVYLLAKEMFNKRVGLIAGGLLALIPYNIYINHVATPDTLLLFFVSWAIYFSYRFAQSLGYRDLILAASMYGIASGVKYNAILLSLILLLFIYFKLQNSKQFNLEKIKEVFLKLVVFGFVSAGVFLLTTPTIITDWDVFWSYEHGKGFLWQLKVNSGPLGFKEYFPALLARLRNIVSNTGYFVGLFFIYSVYSLFEKGVSKSDKQNIFVMSLVAIGFILFTSRYSRATDHYFLPVYGLLAVIAAWGIDKITCFLKINWVLIPIFAFMLFESFLFTYTFVREDTRNIALSYYVEAKEAEGGVTYIRSPELEQANGLNNLGLKSYRGISALSNNDILISEKTIIDNDNIELIDTIDNSFRRGPILYVYKKSK